MAVGEEPVAADRWEAAVGGAHQTASRLARCALSIGPSYQRVRAPVAKSAPLRWIRERGESKRAYLVLRAGSEAGTITVTVPPAHVTGSFLPLELIPLTLAAGPLLAPVDGPLLGRRARPRLAPGLLRRRPGGHRRRALQPDRPHLARSCVIAHMGEHLLIGDIASLLLVLGLTRSLLQPVLAIRFFNRLQVLAHPAVALPLWAAQPVPLAHPGALPGRLRNGPRPRPRARDLPLLRLPDVDAGLRPPAEAGVVRRRLEGRLRGRRCASPGRSSATC